MQPSSDIGTDRLSPDVPLRNGELNIRGLALRYNIWGDETKPPLILQHGMKDHARSWDRLIPTLAAQFCCITPDLRGHGESDWSRGGGYEALEFVADFVLLVRALRAGGIKAPLLIIGHSLGGNIALRFAALYPEEVERVVSVEALGLSAQMYAAITARPATDRWRRALDRRVSGLVDERRIYPSVEKALLPMRRVHPKLADDHLRHLTHHGLRPVDGGFVWKYDPLLSFGGFRPEAPEDYAQIFAAVTCPAAIILGEGSPVSVDAHQRVSAFPNAQLSIYEGAGHWLHHEMPDRFLAEVLAFLTGAEGAAER
ncbi:alpha/beta hydrolase [Parvularcula sp. LCG005]|uniref:alpha/beta fold hydrolase n=1 Tax=Parvularcula sp. LCG005 TaxID=3078805 RepID=UPI0029429464|nr:alpha/beta hydrolase [Parvularcula sp. LCG005]WOI52236.1 alpha/beta hydrolase [Parvularcula sp. LCG005]